MVYMLDIRITLKSKFSDTIRSFQCSQMTILGHLLTAELHGVQSMSKQCLIIMTVFYAMVIFEASRFNLNVNN